MEAKKGTTISNNVLQGVVWDGKAIEAVNNVALALLNLTYLFGSQNIHIDCLLKVDNDTSKEESVKIERKRVGRPRRGK